ncbi:3,4-dihydroxy-2-butanone-4-phosphate synthase [Bacillus coahuilensis]|uniref:3,4-dihydroxy-2-butanone-4-phosphate synthase n=1 Tax=Bacillus coahuilensis TaxID=408580 RepID=UPI000B28C5D7|nr:3,4-dihydroxy-2-butanone-4-phosphate synthase [Bacillus coahuilensis]
MFHTVEEAIEELKNGKIVMVVDDEDRENEGDFIVLSEYATPEAINFMIKEGRGLVCVPITEERAKELKLEPMTTSNTDSHGTAFTISVDHINTHTGISAFERSTTIKALIDERASSIDFKKPGHIFPLVAKDGGVLRRAGHTEAAVDLARLSEAYPSGVICEIIKEDGTMARVPDLIQLSQKYDMKLITIQDLISYRRKNEKIIEKTSEQRLVIQGDTFELITYQDIFTGLEHLALIKGKPSDETTYVRVHAESLIKELTGDSSVKQGIEQMKNKEHGVFLYIRSTKTIHEQISEEELGEDESLKDYGIGAQILQDIGIKKMIWITDHPKKISGLKGHGLEIIETISLT